MTAAVVTPPSSAGTIDADHLLQLVLATVQRNDQLLHVITRRLNAMSQESQDLLTKVGQIEAANASLIGLAQALKAKVDENATAVAAAAATQADVVAANARIDTLVAATNQAVTDSTPAP